jgi:hypothetical protein
MEKVDKHKAIVKAGAEEIYAMFHAFHRREMIVEFTLS